MVSPGMVDGNLWNERPAEVREPAAEQWREASWLHRAGSESDFADAVLFLFTNACMTGSTVYPDGGYSLR